MAAGDIHAAAETGFARAAGAYERGRPGYPAQATDWLVARLGGARVADVAAGTGMLTRELAARGLEVVAIEPVAEMRALIGGGERVRVLDGTAEALALADASVDAVTVAQAFHWFDAARALPEIHRVLRPGGVLALVWNRRRMEDAIHRRIQELLDPQRGDAPAFADGAWRGPLEASELFAPGERREFANEQRLDADGLADRFGSVSFVTSLDEAGRAELLGQIRALAGGGVATLRYRTELELWRRIP